MKTILIAVATPALRLLCESALRDQGFCVVPLDRPLAPLSLVSRLEWDAALLDDGPLGRGALEAISTVSGEKLVGLGFDDSRLSATLALPVSNVEIASVFERLFFEPDQGGPELRLDSARRIAFASGRQVLLTRTEFRLLQLLNDARPADVPFSDVLTSVWGYSPGQATTELVRSHLRNLRHKLREIGLEDVLHSRRGAAILWTFEFQLAESVSRRSGLRRPGVRIAKQTIDFSSKRPRMRLRISHHS